MPTLGQLVDQRTELQLRFLEAMAPAGADTRVSSLVRVSEPELISGRFDVARPSGTLVLLALTTGTLTGRAALATERMLTALAEYSASGLVVTAPVHGLHVFSAATRALARRLRVQLLTTTAEWAAWKTLNEGIARCRAQYAERQVENLAGLLHRLPTQPADRSATQRITEWLASALEAQVRVGTPRREALADATQTEPAPAHLVEATTGGSAGPRVRAETARSAIHTRQVSLAPTGADAAVLAVEADRPFDNADTWLIQHAAKLWGLVDQVHRGYEMAARSAREARAVTYQLLMSGETATARRVMEGLAPGLPPTGEVRVYVTDCGSADERARTVSRYEAVVADRALVIRCPARERHIVLVEPLRTTCRSGTGVARDVERLVLSHAGPHRLGGSHPRPMAGTSLARLLDCPRIRTWAETLLAPLGADRRDLRRTLWAWLDHDGRVKAVAADLNLSEVTVRNHLRTVEDLTGRCLTGLSGIRDITAALTVCRGIPDLSPSTRATARTCRASHAVMPGQNQYSDA